MTQVFYDFPVNASGCNRMCSAAPYNFKWLKQWPLGHLFGEAVPETGKFHSWIQTELPFAHKVCAYFPHRARWRCCPSLLLKEHVSQQTCCLSFLRTTLTSEAEMSFRCFSLQFTCRARGQRCIPFWVTHTSTVLSTKGQAWGINSSLTWTNAIDHFFHSHKSPAVAQVGQRGCLIPALGGLSGSN